MTEPHADSDFAVAEQAGHIQGRPVSWAVVVLVCAGFMASGIALIEHVAWLFFLGVGIVAVGAILGWATHAMADTSARVERRRTREFVAPVGGSGDREPAHQ